MTKIDKVDKFDKFASAVAATPILHLLLTFFIIVLIKSLISLKFGSPWIFQDETVYFRMAEDIFNPSYSSSPPLYPFLISPAYLFSADKSTVYHIMLLITTVINTSVLFPSYFIMRRYCSDAYSLLGSIAVALLPCLVFFNFTLMLENLMLPLFIFSIWFLLEAYRTRTIFWIAAAILSVICLLFTKHSGPAMVFGFLVSGIYYTFADLEYSRISSALRNKGRRKYLLIFAVALSIASSLIYKTAYANPTFRGYINHELYRLGYFSNKLVDIVFNLDLLRQFASFTLNELEYLILSSYFTVFLAAAIFFIYMFNITRGISLVDLDYRNLDDLKGDKSLKASIIYFVFSGAALLAGVVVNINQIMMGIPEGYTNVFMASREDFSLMGRYIDPLVPAIFLFGLIGLNRLRGLENKNRIKAWLLMLYLGTCVLFALTFPFDSGFDILPIGYLKILSYLMPTWAMVPVIMLPFMVLFYLSLFDRKARSLLLLSFILFSATMSAGYLPHAIASSNMYHDQSQIGFYLETHSNDGSVIVMDREDDTKDPIMRPLTEFWADGKVVTYKTAEDPSGVFTDYAKSASYIISSKILPYEPVAYSTRGYLLYRPEKITDNRSFYDFAFYDLDESEGWRDIELRGLPVQGFYPLERWAGVTTQRGLANAILAVFSPDHLWSGLPTHWMQGDAIIAVFSPDNRTADLGFLAQSFYRTRTLEISSGDELRARAAVPSTGFLKVTVPITLDKGANAVRMHVPEGCERPCDIDELKNPDIRCLSMAVQNITVV